MKRIKFIKLKERFDGITLPYFIWPDAWNCWMLLLIKYSSRDELVMFYYECICLHSLKWLHHYSWPTSPHLCIWSCCCDHSVLEHSSSSDQCCCWGQVESPSQTCPSQQQCGGCEPENNKFTYFCIKKTVLKVERRRPHKVCNVSFYNNLSEPPLQSPLYRN